MSVHNLTLTSFCFVTAPTALRALGLGKGEFAVGRTLEELFDEEASSFTPAAAAETGVIFVLTELSLLLLLY
jgi:hypothetical protein